MSNIAEHYEHVLSDIYSWMFGGFENGLSKNREFFHAYEIYPSKSKNAVDLGSGCGFQSIPLAEFGFSVIAIDLSQKLLDELENENTTSRVRTICDDLNNFELHTHDVTELVVCMTDTLLHLESKELVSSLFKKVFFALEKNGKFIITFRDLSREYFELERFVPVRSDKNTIMTCFLEYEQDRVKINDIVYKNSGDYWEVEKSYYRKLRLSKQWVDEQLNETGFESIKSSEYGGLVTIIVSKPI